VKTPEELLREFANNPGGLAQYAAQLQQELAQAQAIIADLKRELFGAKADKLNEQQEEQLRQLLGDAQEQSQRSAPVSQEVLEEALAQKQAEQRQRAKERRRQLPPVELEKQQVIPRQQMVQWVQKVAHLLLAIYWLIWEELKAGDYLQIDESPVKVLDPEVKGKAAQGYLWFYSKPGGYVFLEFNQSRGRDGPRQRLRGFRGTMQTDGYELYDALRKEQPHILKRIGCTSHARRKFYKALLESCSEALWFIGQMRQLYQLERELKDCSPEERRNGRLKKAPAIWLAMKRRAEVIRADPRVLPKSTLGNAVRYLLNEYTALVGYLRDGRFEIDSNLVENDVRPSAVGKKRWLFIGHPDAGWRSAVIYTLIQSCRRYGINPQEYLTDVLERLPSMTSSQVRELLPANWKPRHAKR